MSASGPHCGRQPRRVWLAGTMCNSHPAVPRAGVGHITCLLVLCHWSSVPATYSYTGDTSTLTVGRTNGRPALLPEGLGSLLQGRGPAGEPGFSLAKPGCCQHLGMVCLLCNSAFPINNNVAPRPIRKQSWEEQGEGRWALGMDTRGEEAFLGRACRNPYQEGPGHCAPTEAGQGCALGECWQAAATGRMQVLGWGTCRRAGCCPGGWTPRRHSAGWPAGTRCAGLLAACAPRGPPAACSAARSRARGPAGGMDSMVSRKWGSPETWHAISGALGSRTGDEG